MSDTKTCSKCGGVMEEGFVPDFSNNYALQACWMPGKAEKSFWMGIKNLGEKPRFPVLVYRCQNCGFLEAYAPQAHPDKTKAFRGL